MQNNNVDLITRLVIRIILTFIQACWREINPVIIKHRSEAIESEFNELILLFNWMGVHLYLERVETVWWIRIIASNDITIGAKLTNGQYPLNRSVCDALLVSMHKQFKEQEEADRNARRNCVDHLVSNLTTPSFNLIDRLKGTELKKIIEKPFEEFSSMLFFAFDGKQTITSKYDGFVYIKLNHPVSDEIIYQLFANWVGEPSVKVKGLFEQALPYIETACNTYMAALTKCARNA